MYTEVTGAQEGWWISFQTLASTWEQTETWVLADIPGDQPLARITGWWSRPALAETDLTVQQAKLNELASSALERLAQRVRTTAQLPDGATAGQELGDCTSESANGRPSTDRGVISRS